MAYIETGEIPPEKVVPVVPAGEPSFHEYPGYDDDE
jgi:hypothetical protein